MSKLEFVTPEGFRDDGRLPLEPREMVEMRMGPEATLVSSGASSTVQNVEGCAYLRQGLTKVLAMVKGPGPVVKKHTTLFDRAIVTAEYKVAAYSSTDQKRRMKGDRNSAEKSLWLQRLFSYVILVEQAPRSQIEIFVEVIEDGGSAFSVAVNAVMMALMDSGVAVRDVVASCTVGLLTVGKKKDKRVPLIDLSVSEAEQSGCPQIIIASFQRSSEIALLEFSSKVPSEHFEFVADAGVKACSRIGAEIKTFCKDYAADKFIMSYRNK